MLGRSLLILLESCVVLTRAALGSPAERTALGGAMLPPANSRTSSRREVGRVIIEGSQQAIFRGIKKIIKGPGQGQLKDQNHQFSPYRLPRRA